MNKATLFLWRHWMHGKGMPRTFRAMKFTTTIGIVIAVATLFVALSIALGFGRQYKKSLLDFNAHVVLLTSLPGDEPYTDIVSKLESLHLPRVQITQVQPYLYREALAVHDGKIKGVVMKGIQGKPKQGVLLGAALARHFNLSGEGTISLLIPERGDDAEHILSKTIPVAVAGVFTSGLHDYDSQFVLMDIDETRKIFHIPKEEISGMEITLSDPEKADVVVASLREWLPPSYEAMSWRELNRDLFEAIQLEKVVFAAIMGALVVIAVMNVIAVLILLMLFRQQHISILLALGMSKKSLTDVLVLNGLQIGMVGSAVGSIVGLGVCLLLSKFSLFPIDPEIYYVDRLPIHISPWLCVGIAFFCFFISGLTSYVASRRLTSNLPREGMTR
ncbi:MAG: ABC transporter permease [Deltaproteobacteria bacterium]|nr:ABC transporter permease [Deltaproteobacteria bacterium]